MHQAITSKAHLSGLTSSMVSGDDKKGALIRQAVKDGSFQVYRHVDVSSETGPIHLEECKVFVKVFSTLAQSSLSSLLWNSSKIEKLKQQVQHVHPFNFLESLVYHPPLKNNFISVVDRGGLVWSQCFSKFKENLALQDSMGNLTPFIEDFSKKVQIEPDVVRNVLQKESVQPREVINLILSIPQRV